MVDHSSESVLPRPSFLKRTLKRLSSTRCVKISAEEAAPVAVVALQRYLSEDAAEQPSSYDVTVTDGVWRAKCLLHPALNHLVHSNSLRSGADVVITQCSYIYNERRLGHGYIRIEQLRCAPGPSVLLPQVQDDIGSLPVLVKAGMERSATLQGDVPLLVSRRHYLPLWNNDDPEGHIWTPTGPWADPVLDGELPRPPLIPEISYVAASIQPVWDYCCDTKTEHCFVHFSLPNSVQYYLSWPPGGIFSPHLELYSSSSENNTQIQIKILWEAWAGYRLPLPGGIADYPVVIQVSRCETV